jgi:hypothetical protein
VSTLHITNGDCAAQPLRAAVAGDVMLACDVLHEGPAPAGVEGAEWRQLRARFLSSGDAARYRQILDDLTAADEMLQRAGTGGYSEVVLWFEHDLFDQLNLIRTLDVCAEACPATPVSLVATDGYLGTMSSVQLAHLYPSRRAARADDFQWAQRAWQAFRSPDPQAIVRLLPMLREQVRGLPDPRPAIFLADALERFLAEYPSTVNGLTRTEHTGFSELTSGPLRGRDLFRRSQRGESAQFLGDSTFFTMLLDWSQAPVPLVSIDGAANAGEVFDRPVALTAAGRAVLAGDEDAIRLNGIDRWRGGVHLSGTDTPWRWDPAAQTLVSWS